MKKKLGIILAISIAVILTVSVCSFLFLHSSPTLTVSFIKSTTNQTFIQGNATEYQFDVKVTASSSSNYPFGKSASTSAINNALKPLLDNYDLINGTYEGVTTANWRNEYIADGESTFCLYSYQSLTDSQVVALTNDLYNALSVAMNG